MRGDAHRETSYTCAGVSERMLHTMMPRGVWELVLPIYSKARPLPEPLELDTFFYDENEMVELTAGACMLGGDPATAPVVFSLRFEMKDVVDMGENPSRSSSLLAVTFPGDARFTELASHHLVGAMGESEAACSVNKKLLPKPGPGPLISALGGGARMPKTDKERVPFVAALHLAAHGARHQPLSVLGVRTAHGARRLLPATGVGTASRRAWAAATRTSTASTARTTPSPPRSGWPPRRASAPSARATP